MALALLTLFAGVVSLCFALYVGRKMWEESNWPTVPGKLRERGITGTGRTYYPYVKYTYSIGGRVFTHDRLYLVGRARGIAGNMQQIVDRLPDPVPVHYDSKDPAKSYLLINPKSHVWIPAAMGGGALLLGLMQLFVELTKGLD